MPRDTTRMAHTPYSRFVSKAAITNDLTRLSVWSTTMIADVMSTPRAARLLRSADVVTSLAGAIMARPREAFGGFRARDGGGSGAERRGYARPHARRDRVPAARRAVGDDRGGRRLERRHARDRRARARRRDAV